MFISKRLESFSPFFPQQKVSCKENWIRAGFYLWYNDLCFALCMTVSVLAVIFFPFVCEDFAGSFDELIPVCAFLFSRWVGDIFFLACDGFAGSFDELIPVCSFFFLFSRLVGNFFLCMRWVFGEFRRTNPSLHFFFVFLCTSDPAHWLHSLSQDQSTVAQRTETSVDECLLTKCTWARLLGSHSLPWQRNQPASSLLAQGAYACLSLIGNLPPRTTILAEWRESFIRTSA